MTMILLKIYIKILYVIELFGLTMNPLLCIVLLLKFPEDGNEIGTACLVYMVGVYFIQTHRFDMEDMLIEMKNKERAWNKRL